MIRELTSSTESLVTHVPLNHVVAFFHSREEEYDTLMPFIRGGFTRGDKAFHIVDPKLVSEHLERLRSASIDTAEAEARHQLEVRNWLETYLRSGRFDPDDMIGIIERILHEGRSQGFAATRVVGHMEWLLSDWPGDEIFFSYETGLNRVLPRYRDPVICVYNCSRFDARIIMQILRTHPAVMISGVLHQNPFFIPADELLADFRKRGGTALVPTQGDTSRGRIRRAISELVALSILPAEWVGRDPGQVAEEIVSILLSCPRIDAASLRLRHEGVDVARTHAEGWPQFQEWLRNMDNPPPGAEAISGPRRIELAGGGKTLYVLQIPIGIEAQGGWIAVGSVDSDFPDEMEMLALTVAANQGLTSFQNARALHERERTAKVIEVLEEDVDRTGMFDELLGSSPGMQKVISKIRKVAPTDSTVLITGETGTGKELVARSIHKRSRRAHQPFISVNGAALPGPLIASELFGHEKGAFTGAEQRRLGRFELADHGTLFLDEVGELSMEVQAALLRVLQERVIERLGGTRPIPVDVRLIAATNRDLTEAVAKGTFRSDLYYRLHVFPIEVPPLRDRSEDIPSLTRHFIDRFAATLGKEIKQIDAATLERFRRYSWPGNVRELQNVIERSLILSEGDTFSMQGPLSATDQLLEHKGSLTERLAAYERELIENALRESEGKVSGESGAAGKLGVPPTTLESRIRALNIKKNRFRG